MGAGAYLEPLAVILLLFGGAWINRDPDYSFSIKRSRWRENPFEDDTTDGDMTPNTAGFKGTDAQALFANSRSLSPSLLASQTSTWRTRELRFWGKSTKVTTPNTAVFQNRLLSRLLHKFPFLVEAWYWALIYWVYQLGRAFTAVTLVEGTVHVARKHALQLIELEKRLHMFWELPVQRFFMGYPHLMIYINWLYSFIHIPGTITFLVWLYYYTVTSNRMVQLRSDQSRRQAEGSPSGPGLYEARRRTMAVCNLLAFMVFTIWPCMPPRLLSESTYMGAKADLAKSYGFVDTVHGKDGASSVWTQNRFCNQYAAMPSLHFGYSFMIGLTILSIPLAPEHRRSRSIVLPFFNNSHPELAPHINLPSSRRMACILIGTIYPLSILIAIFATANHFVLDAVAGAVVCAVGWRGNSVLLNLLPLEDYFLWCLRLHKPVLHALDTNEADDDQYHEESVKRPALVHS